MTRMDANKIVEKLEMNPFGIAHLAYGLRLAGRDRQAAGQEAAKLFNRLFKAPASQLGELTLAQRVFVNWFICGYNAQSSQELPALPKEVDLSYDYAIPLSRY